MLFAFLNDPNVINCNIVGSHIVLMSFLHFVFSDAKKYWQKGGFLNLSFFHYLIGNGLANIYIHNWIRSDTSSWALVLK
jgi:hypothetical protein